MALVALLFVGLGRHFAYCDYDCSADEFLAHFQSQIFVDGHLLEPIPEKWQPFANIAVLPFETYNPQQQAWCSEYLPVHSLLRVPETWLGVDGYTSAFYLGLNLIALYYLLRRVWPRHPSRAAVGLVLFIVFPQVLVTSMSSYAMETHALFATVWLLLYLSGIEAIFLLTPWFGILCLGIHQPHIQLLFAAPFVLWLALQRRWFAFFYFCAVYLAGVIFWIAILHLIRPSSVADGLLNKFGFNPILQGLIQMGNVALLLAWTPLALTLLLAPALLSLRWKNVFVLCSLAAFGLLAGLYMDWPTQGHGWGERFLYPALPFVIIVALHGLGWLRIALGRRGMMNLIAYSAAFALVVDLPYRLGEVHEFEVTYRAVHDALASTDADVVLLDTERIWFGRDFVQNDPTLKSRPVILSLFRLTPAQAALLRKDKLTIKIIGYDDLRATGQPEDYLREQD